MTLANFFPSTQGDKTMNMQPAYHIYFPNAFINDPNGLLYYDGWYHVFCQWNPEYPEGRRVGWAHLRSTDLIHWEELPPALLPESWYDNCGCYSGSAIVKNGRIHLIYTGNVRNKAGERESYQCMAVSDDGIHFSKFTKNPLISGPADGYTADYRDPNVFSRDGQYWFVLGVQTCGGQGRTLLYRSADLLSWKLEGPLQFDETGLFASFGYMWECPNLFELRDGEQKRAALLFCPQGLQPDGMRFQNRYQCGYVLASDGFNGLQTFRGCTSFTELDQGFEFYAPQVFQAGDRTLLLGWMGMPEEEDQPSKSENWMHCLTVPRVLTLRNETIYQWPVEELENLHGEKRELSLLELENASKTLSGFFGDRYDMQVAFDLTQANLLTLCLRKGSRQQITITCADGVLTVDRSKSAYAPGNPQRQIKLADPSTLRLRVLSDRSAMELYINDGQQVLSLRTYLDEDALQTEVSVQGKVVLTSGTFFPMGSISR